MCRLSSGMGKAPKKSQFFLMPKLLVDVELWKILFSYLINLNFLKRFCWFYFRIYSLIIAHSILSLEEN